MIDMGLKFRRNQYLTLIGLFVVLFLTQCKTSHKSSIAATEGPQSREFSSEKALLWMISKEDVKDSSFLFGTIHMIPSERYFLPKGTEEAIQKAAKLIFEVDMKLVNDPMQQMAMLQKSMMKGDVSLSDLLSEEDYLMVKNHFNGMGIPFFLLEKIKPIFLSVFADENLFKDGELANSMKYYELEFFEMAEEQGKEVGGLESIDFQLSIMDSIPYQDQADMLLEAIKSKEAGTTQMDSLIQLFVDQDIEALHASFEADSISKFDSLLLINRNRLWIPLMEEEMAKQSCFFAVGGGHLGGSDGVIHLLKEEGYKLEAISKK